MTRLFGVMAEFRTPEDLVLAAHRARAAGYTEIDAYTPFPVEGLHEALGHHETRLPLLILVGGIVGGLGGFFMQEYAAVIGYPLNIGGRPLNSWPSFIPITFELTILVAGLTAVIAMIALNKLPQPYHPVFDVPGFERASSDRFFLCLEASGKKFDPDAARRFLEGLKAENVAAVEGWGKRSE